MIGRFLCWWHGKHLRGKRYSDPTSTSTVDARVRRFQCPRCKRVTVYKQKTERQ